MYSAESKTFSIRQDSSINLTVLNTLYWNKFPKPVAHCKEILKDMRHHIPYDSFTYAAWTGIASAAALS